MSAQTASYPPVYNTQFAFLAKPPPPTQKKRASPNAPLPAPPSTPPPTPPKYLQRRRSNTFSSSIAAWAAHVQPGSPAPRSPHRRPSVTSTTSSRRPSITRPTRRPSISHSRAPSGSFIHLIDTPTRTHSTPSVANFDLTGLGYTSVFVHFPKTPSTPSPLLRQYQQIHRAGAPVPPKAAAGEPLSANPAFAHIPIPPIPVPEDAPSRPVKKSGMKRFRSLSILRPKGSKNRDTNLAPASPTKTALSTKSSKPSKSSAPKTPKAPKPNPEASAASIANRKRAKYAYVRPPPPLANELAMMQFADGGSLESHAKRVMEAQAKAALGTGVGAGGGVYVGVGDVYRDGKGGIWWDADEEMEYAHLLEGADKENRDAEDVEMEDWEEFGFGADAAAGEPLSPFFASQNHPTTIPPHRASSDKENHPAPIPSPLSPTRRSSLSTVDSDLDPKYLLPLPENADPRLLPLDDRALASRRIGGAGMSVLSLPARPRRRERHLCKPGFLVDVPAFQAGGDLNLNSSASFGEVQGVDKPRGKARRRPAPLKLASSNQVVVVVRRPSQVAAQLQADAGSSPLSPTLAPAPGLAPAPSLALAPLIPSPITLEKTRREFIADSFEPLVPSPVQTQTQQRPNLTNAAINASVLSLSGSGSTKPAAAKSRTGVRGLFGLGRKAD